MRLRFPLPLLLVSLLLLVSVSGCGGSSAGAKLDAAVAQELTYFPAGSPFVMTIATDPNSDAIKHAQGLEAQFPLAAFAQTALMTKLTQLGINYRSDIRPLFGHPLMAGADGTSVGGGAHTPFLVAWVTSDGDKLKALLKKVGGLLPAGSHAGASLYQAGSAAVAVSGDTLLVARDPARLTAALDRHDHGGAISPATIQRETANLPSGSLIQMFGDLSTVLGQPSAARARSVPWVAALRGYAAALSVSSTGVTFRFHLDTSGGKLSPSQLPFAAGSATPSLTTATPISAGVHDPAQILTFVEGAEQATKPSAYARFQRREAQIRTRTGVDLAAFAKLLTGDLIVGSDTHTTMGRVQVSDPTTARADLDKLLSTSSPLFSGGAHPRRLAGGFYRVPGSRPAVVGLVGNQLVAGNVTPAQLTAFAAAPTTPAAGAQGTIAFRVDLGRLLTAALKHAPKVAQTLLAQVGGLTGWAAASPGGVDGAASVSVK